MFIQGVNGYFLIAHVDMDAFYASVEVLDHPQLRGKPVIVGHGKRGVVSAASYEARKFGVRSAMPIFQARKLCPQGHYMPPRRDRYSAVSRKVMAVLEGFSPLVEPISVDEAFLDLGGTELLWGPPHEAGMALKRAMLQKTGLVCSVGIAPVRFLAKIASDRDKPDGLVVVDDLEAFLPTVRLKEISGVGAKSQKRLKLLGLTRLTQLRELGKEELERIMGSIGPRLWELSMGIDPTGVSTTRKIKSISHEITLGDDTADRELIRSYMLGMSQKVGRRLRAKGLCAKTVTIKLKHTDFKLVTRSKGLSEPTDQASDIFTAAKELLSAYKPAGPFRLIGVGTSGLVPWDRAQAPLLDRERKDKERAVARAEDELVKRFGDKALVRGGALNAFSKRGQKE
jgi:DNA polymerase-4